MGMLTLQPPGRPIPAEAALIVPPGSKATIACAHEIECPSCQVAGSAVLDIQTGLARNKKLERTVGDRHGSALDGYETHMGEATVSHCERPFARLDGSLDEIAVSLERHLDIDALLELSR